jgi:hypothetical protein
LGKKILFIIFNFQETALINISINYIKFEVGADDGFGTTVKLG